MAKKQAKKRHIANSDTDSENSYQASQPTKSSSSTSTKTPYVPRFLYPATKVWRGIMLYPSVSVRLSVRPHHFRSIT